MKLCKMQIDGLQKVKPGGFVNGIDTKKPQKYLLKHT